MSTIDWYLSVFGFLSFGYVLAMMTLPLENKKERNEMSLKITMLKADLEKEKLRVLNLQDYISKLEGHNNYMSVKDTDFEEYM